MGIPLIPNPQKYRLYTKKYRPYKKIGISLIPNPQILRLSESPIPKFGFIGIPKPRKGLLESPIPNF